MTENKHYRLGDLLLAAEILTSEYIKDALAIYESQGLPLGKVLVASGYLNDSQLKSALDLQYMVNDQLLEFDKAKDVMVLCHSQNLSVSEAFIKAKIVKPEENETNKLGQLLISAEIIESEELEDCLKANENTSLPLGHIICHRGLISQPLINRTLAVQNLIRTNKLMRDIGISSLKWANQRELELQELESNKGYIKKPLKATPKLGDFLAECRLLSETQINEILVTSVTQNKTFGAVLAENSNFSKNTIESIVEIQEMIDRKTVSKVEAIEALPGLIKFGYSSIRAISESEAYKMLPNQAPPLIDLLKASGVLKVEQIPSEIQESLTVNYNQVRQVVQKLIKLELISESILFSALRLVNLVQTSKVSYEKAIVALEFSNRSGKDIEYTLYMTGVFDRTRLKEHEYQD